MFDAIGLPMLPTPMKPTETLMMCLSRKTLFRRRLRWLDTAAVGGEPLARTIHRHRLGLPFHAHLHVHFHRIRFGADKGVHAVSARRWIGALERELHRVPAARLPGRLAAAVLRRKLVPLHHFLREAHLRAH